MVSLSPIFPSTARNMSCQVNTIEDNTRKSAQSNLFEKFLCVNYIDRLRAVYYVNSVVYLGL